jgi:CBS domain-containing protein
MRWSIKIAQIAGTEVRIHLTFPMDGGRVLRSLLAMTLPYARATQIAAWIGQALAFVFGFVGLFTNPMLIFIAFFIFLGAQRESAMAQMKDLSLNLRVAEAMVTHLVRLPPDATLEDAVEALLRTSQHEFPVVDEDDRVLGVLTRDGLIAALKHHGPQTPVVNVMQRDLPVLQADEPFDKAFQLMQQSAFPALPVVDRRLGRLRGLITPENIGELMMVSALLPRGVQPVWRGTTI